ncbi:MAG: FAD-dependent oxidoreductase [Thermomicrobiales bacterium]
MERTAYPVVVIGAGPVGLAAAAHLLDQDLEPLVLERGAQVGASVASWGHVRLFTPWRYATDRAAERLLGETGWQAPDPETYPTGAELVTHYLEPLAQHPRMHPCIRLGAEVVGITRAGLDKMTTPGREDAPFLVTIRDDADEESTVLAQAVIDASGTWTCPNPLGASGRPAIGERAAQDRIAYGIPDVLGSARARYAGRRVLVVGSGHSAFNVLLDLVDLAAEVPGTEITWAIRKPAAQTGILFGGGINDALPARGELGARVRSLVEIGQLRMVTGLRIASITATPAGLVVSGDDTVLDPVDEIIAATGFRPDLDLLAEVRLSLDPAVEAPTALAPLIDPNVHSCGSVPPHGAIELAHPERDLYVVGMKSYGRAPTFLLLTGYEQVRSVAAAIAADWDAAREVQLVLPETGVCSSSVVLGDRGVACCGTAAASVDDSCCATSTTTTATTTASSGSSCCGETVPQVISLKTLTRGGCC